MNKNTLCGVWLLFISLGNCTSSTNNKLIIDGMDASSGLDTGAGKMDGGTKRDVLLPDNQPQLVPIPAGTFIMGDHFGLGGEDPKHPSDELPLHQVTLSAFFMGMYEVTNNQYHAFLTEALAQGQITVESGFVKGVVDGKTYCGTYASEGFSHILWDGKNFSLATGKANHPVIDIRWDGAVAYCNWLSVKQGLQEVYALSTGTSDLTKNGYRLPTEAEWEYAANGGQLSPYKIFPWGDDKNLDGTYANWQESKDPFEFGPLPWTTPVGFYNGALQKKADFNWPGSQETYQTANGANGYGLHDMSGNAWELTNDWYDREYYKVSPELNPPGPIAGNPMPDTKPYRVMRGGNWYNGKEFYGHGRIANRNPSYYRGPQDPNHPWYHVGFRVVRPKN